MNKLTTPTAIMTRALKLEALSYILASLSCSAGLRPDTSSFAASVLVTWVSSPLRPPKLTKPRMFESLIRFVPADPA